MPTKNPARSRKRDRKWYDGFDKRLRLLIRVHGPSQAKFANACDLNPQLISDWLAQRQLPSTAHVLQIGHAIGASADWLLYGDGGEQPVYRNQSRPDVDLEHDVEDRVARMARGLVPHKDRHLTDVILARARVDAGAILRDAAASLADDIALVKGFEKANLTAQELRRDGIMQEVEGVELRYLRDDRSEHPPKMIDLMREAADAPPRRIILSPLAPRRG